MPSSTDTSEGDGASGTDSNSARGPEAVAIVADEPGT
jgi:hypothetical protein